MIAKWPNIMNTSVCIVIKRRTHYVLGFVILLSSKGMCHTWRIAVASDSTCLLPLMSIQVSIHLFCSLSVGLCHVHFLPLKRGSSKRNCDAFVGS